MNPQTVALSVPPLESAVTLEREWSLQPLSSDAHWPTDSWSDLRTAGVTRWTIPSEFGGDNCAADVLLDGCIELARGQLLVTFILSQFQAACQRLAVAASRELKQRWLPRLATGECFATVGISHLTTSRQHTVQPAVIAEPTANGYRLTGEIPWVTGANRADVIVVGGTLADGRQVLTAAPRDRDGLTCSPPWPLLALGGSETGPIRLDGMEVTNDELIAGPALRVLQTLPSGGAGSLTTSALAVGHALACCDHLSREAAARPELQPMTTAFQRDLDDLRRDLLNTARGSTGHTPETLRTRATDLALRMSQALLTASKGAGFVRGHPVERLAREALFFLVWSCPQTVANQLMNGFSQCVSE